MASAQAERVDAAAQARTQAERVERVIAAAKSPHASEEELLWSSIAMAKPKPTEEGLAGNKEKETDCRRQEPTPYALLSDVVFSVSRLDGVFDAPPRLYYGVR